MRKLILWVVAIAAAAAAVTTTGGRSQAGVIAPIGLREAAATKLKVMGVERINGNHGTG